MRSEFDIMPFGFIYQIRNTVNNKRYIGSTNSIGMRRKEHLSALRREKHHSPILQRAFNKYGEQAFVFEIIKAGIPVHRLLEIEQQVLDELRPEYNTSPFAVKPPPTNLHSKESRLKRAEACFKPVIQYKSLRNLRDRSKKQTIDDLSFVRSWPSLKSAAEALDICESQITDCCQGRIKSAGGFVFKYENEFIEYKPGEWATMSKEERGRKTSDRSARTFEITPPGKPTILISNLRKYCQDNGLNIKSAYNFVAGFKKVYKRYQIRRID